MLLGYCYCTDDLCVAEQIKTTEKSRSTNELVRRRMLTGWETDWTLNELNTTSFRQVFDTPRRHEERRRSNASVYHGAMTVDDSWPKLKIPVFSSSRLRKHVETQPSWNLEINHGNTTSAGDRKILPLWSRPAATMANYTCANSPYTKNTQTTDSCTICLSYSYLGSNESFLFR